MAGIGQLFNALFGVLPRPVALALGLLLGLWLLRGFQFRTRVRQVRGLVRRMLRADAPTRARLVSEVLALAGEQVHLLGELAREAHRRGERELFGTAVERLGATAAGRTELARVRRLEGLDRPPPDVHAHVARVAGLLDSGLHEAARERLAEALVRHPEDPLLLGLQRRLDAERPGSGADIG